MGAIIDMRTADMKALRDKNRALRRALAEIDDIVRDNDATVALQHELALLLLARHSDWKMRAEKLLRRGMRAGACQLIVFNTKQTQLAKAAKKLPQGGGSLNHLLADVISENAVGKSAKPTKSAKLAKPAKSTKLTKSTASNKAQIYYHLPLRRSGKTIGLLVLTMRQSTLHGGDDADDALCRRLSALLVAAL